MKLIDDDGTEIKISDETARNIREARKPRDKEARFDEARVSTKKDRQTGYPIRISILRGQEGEKMGVFPNSNIGSLPGCTLNEEDARAMANYILKLCNELEKK